VFSRVCFWTLTTPLLLVAPTGAGMQGVRRSICRACDLPTGLTFTCVCVCWCVCLFISFFVCVCVTNCLWCHLFLFFFSAFYFSSSSFYTTPPPPVLNLKRENGHSRTCFASESCAQQRQGKFATRENTLLGASQSVGPRERNRLEKKIVSVQHLLYVSVSQSGSECELFLFSLSVVVAFCFCFVFIVLYCIVCLFVFLTQTCLTSVCVC
jgi:hypothetical protein